MRCLCLCLLLLLAATACARPNEKQLAEERVAAEAFAAERAAAGYVLGTRPRLAFPLAANASAYPGKSFWSVSAFFDHGGYDYNGGTRRYSGHTGTDFYITPFRWFMVNHAHVLVVAAADGNLTATHDGEDDNHCAACTGCTANYATVTHADGSVTGYWHMRKGSVTTKPLKSFIAAGEVLGSVASSGSSTGPHLHFMVRPSASGAAFDPFLGPLNPDVTEQWWEVQPPYWNPDVLDIFVGTAQFVYTSCPDEETPNRLDVIPEAATSFYTTWYFKDVLKGLVVNNSLVALNGTALRTWRYTFTGNATQSYLQYQFTKQLPAGTYRMVTTLESPLRETPLVCRRNFAVGSFTPGFTDTAISCNDDEASGGGGGGGKTDPTDGSDPASPATRAAICATLLLGLVVVALQQL